jgi:peptidoglycan/LPS O-acetylase OafA/YrhL
MSVAQLDGLSHATKPSGGAGSASTIDKALYRVRFLDALRFVAAAAVLMQHSLEFHNATGKVIVDTLSPGVFGVVLFFVVSGFVIPMSAGKKFELRRFAIRRFFRIYPLVLFAFVVVAFAGYSGLLRGFGPAASASLRDWICNLLLIQDYTGVQPLLGVTWTLSLEIAWYALFASALLLLGGRFDSVLAICLPIAMIALAVASLGFGQRLPLARIGMVYAAILGCRAYRRFRGDIGYPRFMLDASIFIIVMVICNVISFGYFRHPNITAMQAIGPWIAAPALFVLVCSIPAIQNSRLLNGTIVGWLGAVSFSTYLLHPFALDFARTYSPQSVSLGLGLLLTLLVSLVGYHLVEVPGQALGRRLTAR